MDAEKGKVNGKKVKPIMTFKKVIKSPEYLHAEYSRASLLQKLLWAEHTT